MPFTFAHPAIVIPFKKYNKYFNFTALVIGSMAPDFEYFLRFAPIGKIGHTLYGFFYFNLPICFMVAYLFHHLIKKSFILNMPRPMDEWYSCLAFKKWGIRSISDFIIFSYSAFIGMFSHVFWDSFTHNGGKFVKMLPLLSKNISFLNFHIHFYKVLQHGSTILGFIIIFILLYFNRNKNNRNAEYISTKMKIIYHLSILLIGIGIVSRKTFLLGGFYFNYLGSYVVSFISGLMIGSMIVSLIIYNFFMRN